MESEKTFESSLMTMKLIWGALFVSQFVYIFVAGMLLGAPMLLNFEGAETFVVMMSLMAFSMPAVAFLIFKLLLRSAKKVEDRPDAARKYFVPFIIRLVLIESCVIYGLVVSFTAEANYVVNFVVVSVICFLISFPTQSKIEAFMRRSVYKFS